MISNINPLDIEKMIKDRDQIDQELLRIAIIAELDAVNLYEQIANITKNAALKKVMLDVAKEEKTHVGEFQAMLLRFDEEQVAELMHGKEEVEEMTSKVK